MKTEYMSETNAYNDDPKEMALKNAREGVTQKINFTWGFGMNGFYSTNHKLNKARYKLPSRGRGDEAETWSGTIAEFIGKRETERGEEEARKAKIRGLKKTVTEKDQLDAIDVLKASGLDCYGALGEMREEILSRRRRKAS